MAESKMFLGRVLKKSLPIITPPSGPQDPVLKRLALPQGELAQVYDGEEGIRYIAYIELLPGNPRGNHYHKAKEEWIYLVQGEFSLLLQDVETKESAKVSLVAGDLVRISTGIAHTLKILKGGQAIEFSTAKFDPTDIHRYPLSDV